MATSPRILAARRRRHLIITAWPSRSGVLRKGFAIRAAGSVFSADQSVISIADGTSTYAFPPILIGSLDITERFDLSVSSFRIELAFWRLRPGQYPKDVHLNGGFAEIAEVYENATGDGLVESWDGRRVKVKGRIVDAGWGRRDEQYGFTILQEEVRDRGSIYIFGAQMSSDRFADVSATEPASTSRALSFKSNGLYPPIPIAPNTNSASLAGKLESPLLVVVDEVDANSSGPTNLTPRRLLITYEPLYDTSTARDLIFRDQQRPSSISAGTNSDVNIIPNYDYTIAPSQGTDLLSTPYWYFPGSLTETLPNLTFTGPAPGPASALITGGTYTAKVGDQIKKATDTDAFYETIQEIGEAGIRLTSTYAGGSGMGDATLIRRPIDEAYSLYWKVENKGGITNLRGDRPLSNPLEVVEWLLLRSRPSYPIDFGSLRALRPRCEAWQTFHVINQDSDPLTYATGHFLQYLPIRPYLEDGFIRFAWVGPCSEHEIVTTIDLDDRDRGIWREEPVSETPATDVRNEVTIQFDWSIRRNLYVLALSVGSEQGVGRGVYGNGRAYRSQRMYEPEDGTEILPYARPIEPDPAYDTIGDINTAILAGVFLLYQTADIRPLMTLRGLPAWGWLRIGDIIQVSETETTTECQAWRILAKTTALNGEVAFELEGLPDIQGVCRVAASVSFSSAPEATAAALTVGTDYELLDATGRPTAFSGLTGCYLANKRYRTFARTARAVGAADSENGWTWVNRASLGATNDEDTTTNDRLHLTHAAAITNITTTGPYRYVLLNPIPGTFRVYARMTFSSAANANSWAAIQVQQDSSTSNYIAIRMGDNGGTMVVGDDGSPTTVALTAGEVTTGIWCRIDVIAGRIGSTYYSKADQAEPPTSYDSTGAAGWALIRSANAEFDSGAILRVGQRMYSVAGNALTAEWLYFDVEILNEAGQVESDLEVFGAQGYPTNGSAITLISAWDMGAGRVDETKLRYKLQQIVNTRRGDAASWTFSCVQSTSTSISAGTYAAAASVTVEGSGRYCSLFAKCDSSGNTQPGSLTLPFSLPIKGA